MTRKSLLALVAVLLSATGLTSAAEAGDGVKLNFGYPMGSFVATPARGGSYGAKAAAAHKLPQKKQKPVSVARHVEQDAPKARAEAKKTKPAKVETASVRRDSGKTKSVKSETSTIVTEDAPLTGSKALAGTDAAGTEAATGTSAAGETTTSSEETPVAVVSETVTQTAATETADDTGEVGCKKFIPAIGVTVTVGCNK